MTTGPTSKQKAKESQYPTRDQKFFIWPAKDDEKHRKHVAGRDANALQKLAKFYCH